MITGSLIICPLIFSLIIFFVKSERWMKNLAVTGSTIEFLVSIYGLFLYTTKCNCLLLLYLGSVEKLGISFRLGMDGISLLLVLLTTFLIPFIILSAIQQKHRYPSVFYGLIMLMEMAIIGVFSAYDGMLFFLFWELTIIPVYLLWCIEDCSGRIRLTVKYFLKSTTGSLLMLSGLIFIFLRTPLPHSFDLYSLTASVLSLKEQSWVFLAFFVAFIIQTSVFLTDTKKLDSTKFVQSTGSMILAGIILKIGLYGLLRFLFPICTLVMNEWRSIILVLVLMGIIFSSILAVRQKDMKRMIIYFSIINIGLISSGIFTMNSTGLNGSVIQMISHGINCAGLFMIIDRIEIRLKTTEISRLGGIAIKAPWLGVLFFIFLLGSIGFPFTNGFVGEILILAGVFSYNPWIAVAFGTTIIFSAVYLLRTFQGSMLGETGELTSTFHDLTWRESLTMIPLAVVVWGIGIFPGLLLQLIDPAVKEILYFAHL
jgi:NADH-quinone oxidoreductase subunit M